MQPAAWHTACRVHLAGTRPFDHNSSVARGTRRRSVIIAGKKMMRMLLRRVWFKWPTFHSKLNRRGLLRWGLGLTIFGMITVVPFVYFRASYAHGKRLRVVTPEKFYRCGQLTSSGFREAIAQYGIKTVINLQDENPDPVLPDGYFHSKPEVPESELCRQLGARYILLNFDLPTRDKAPLEHPKVIDEYLKILDDPASYPILLHCKAGLHRTGLLTAIYRMEYERWPVGEAMRELRANGFGDFAATSANDYIYAFLELYQPRWRKREKPARLEKISGEAGTP
jgi:tyrosine-protein phosphatase SIW14